MPKSTPINELSESQKSELATSLAALVLVDGEQELSEANLNAALSAAKCTVEPHFPTMFAALLSNIGEVDVKDMIKFGGGGGGGGAGGAAGGEAAAEEEKVEEEEEEEAVEVGNMFGGDDDDGW
jgi:large subunit ribosomal protein LP1